jgi:uncharacterized protein YgiM (DUF1202 family)
MLSRNLTRSKKLKTPQGKRRKVIVSTVLGLALFFIIFGVYKLNSYKMASGKKEAVKVETGDRPLKKTTAIFISADGGLSLRKDRDSKSPRIALIPNKTQLEATEELDGWYKVTYNGKTGWIAKQYTTTQAPAEDPTKTWSVYTSPSQGYKIKYPLGWKLQNYGANAASKSLSLVAFSNQELPTTIPQGSEFIAPVTIQVSSKTIEEANQGYATISGVTSEKLTIAGAAATKYTYTSISSNTQMIAIVFSLGGRTFVLAEGGGYGEDLIKMANTFSL